MANADEAAEHLGVRLSEPEPGAYDAIVLAVGHRQFAELGEAGIRRLGREGHVIFDLKHLLPREAAELRL